MDANEPSARWSCAGAKRYLASLPPTCINMSSNNYHQDALKHAMEKLYGWGQGTFVCA
ncbi:hypothetical protein FKP32DRAFT_1675100 [Trametes sanguinea]|nr:hypothetical protein FKP32DRAFT_1675100 [Trametes sanguinea]